jgi:hypothetical protein
LTVVSFVPARADFGVAELFGVAKDVEHEALLFGVGRGSDGDEMFAAAEGDLSDAAGAGFVESFAHDGEGFGLRVVFGSDEVGALEEDGRELVRFDELLNLHGGGGGEAEGLEFLGIDLDVFVAGVLEAFDEVGGFDSAGVGDVLVMDAVMGAAIDLMELHLAGWDWWRGRRGRRWRRGRSEWIRTRWDVRA